MDKYIVIDGVKYEIDPNDKTKAKLDADGKPVPYVESKEDDKKIDLSKVSVEDLKKVNPEVAKAMEDLEVLKKQQEDDAKVKEEEARQKAEKDGDFKKLLDDSETKRKTAEDQLTKTTKILEDHQETIKTILEATLKDVPEDKIALIPKDYSPRKKLEYVTENAKILGINISPANKGGDVPPNDTKVNLDDETKLTAEYDELLKKGATRTPIEKQKMIELAQKIKEIRNANATKV